MSEEDIRFVSIERRLSAVEDFNAAILGKVEILMQQQATIIERLNHFSPAGSSIACNDHVRRVNAMEESISDYPEIKVKVREMSDQKKMIFSIAAAVVIQLLVFSFSLGMVYMELRRTADDQKNMKPQHDEMWYAYTKGIIK